jgi:hypothetical protein
VAGVQRQQTSAHIEGLLPVKIRPLPQMKADTHTEDGYFRIGVVLSEFGSYNVNPTPDDDVTRDLAWVTDFGL